MTGRAFILNEVMYPLIRIPEEEMRNLLSDPIGEIQGFPYFFAETIEGDFFYPVPCTELGNNILDSVPGRQV
jgi:hypothetical protein